MLNVLKQLQASMTSKDDTIRAEATKQFREQLEQMQVLENDAELLFEFFLCKLSDPQSIIDTTHILLNLSKKQKNINLKLLQMIQLKQVFIPGFSRVPRINFYYMFLGHTMTYDLASAILNSIAGEKDPRNILIAFQLIDQILAHEEIAKQYRNEIFEFLDCYYPIEFQENADKRFNITKSEIDALLNKCLFNKILIDESILMLQDKIISPYGAAQSSALESVVWILENSNAVSYAQMDDIYDSIQKLSEQVIMDDKVIDQIPIALKSFISSRKFPKLAERILKIAYKTVEEIPATQQGFIYFNLLKKLVKDKFEIFQEIVTIFNKKFDTCNLNVAQKRLETIISIATEYKKESREYYTELKKDEVEKLFGLLTTAINHKVSNIFIMALKSLLEIVPYFLTYAASIEQYLLQQIVSREFIEQKCILDYFCLIKIQNNQLYKEQVEYWYEHNRMLFIYSFQCSFVNIENYCENFIINHIFSNQDQYLNQYIDQVKAYFLSENIKNQQVQINAILKYLKQINFKIEFQNKKIKQLIQLIIEKQDYQIFSDEITFETILSIEDHYLYYYLPFFSKSVNQQFCEKVKSYLENSQFTATNQLIVNKRRYIYKVILRCLQQSKCILQIDENPNLQEMELKFNDDGLNQLELFKVILRQQIMLSNEKAINVLMELKNTEPKILMQIIKENDLNLYKHMDSLLVDLIKGTKDKETLNYLINLADENSMTNLFNIETLQLLVEHFNDKKIDQLKQIALIVVICDSLKQSVIQTLVKLQTTDIKAIYTILTIVTNKFEEARYNANLHNLAMEYFNNYLRHPKRIVRKAAQEAVNEWCIVFGKGL